jgi:hypothetical protein
MTKIVRTLGIGRCSLLGELIDETETRYFYRRHFGHALASFVDKRSPVVHIVPCKACRTIRLKQRETKSQIREERG